MDYRTIGRKMPRARYSRPEPYKSSTKPQKWMGDWYVYVPQPGGKDKRVHRGPVVLGKCSEMTKGEAQKELDRRISEERRPRDQKAPGPETLEYAIRKYLDAGKSLWEPETHATMSSVCKHLAGIWEQSLPEVTRESVQDHLNALAAKFSQSTVKKIRNVLSSVFADAHEDGKITRNPMRKVRMPKTRKPTSRYLTEAECMQLLSAAYGRDHLICRIAIVLGLRPGEIFALREDDVEPGRLRIDEASREATIKDPKTAASAAYVSLPPSLAAEIQAWMKQHPDDPKGLLFPSERPGVPIRQNNFLKRNLHAIAVRAGLEGVTFQSLRRTTATHAQHVGSVKDVQGMLRHANPDVTAGVYMQTVPESVARAVAELDRKLSGGVLQ